MTKTLLLLLTVAALPAAAQNPPAGAPPTQPATATPTIPARWDVSARRANTRDVEFDTNVGTWMSLDLSPDGSTIVFDLLGDIYTMPAAGGTATLIRTGPAFESQPRFSPDGRRIAFSSDRDGLMNIWTMDLAGGDLRQISREREREVSNPAWTPDGQYLVGRKHFRNTRSLGAGEMWLYHVAGGNGLKLTDRRNWEQNATEPVVSPDGRYVYFTEDVSPGGGFQYNRDPHGVIYVVQRLDRQTGRRATVIGGNGGSLRPQPSPDGKSMAFVRRVGMKSVLFVRDMESGRETPVFDGLDHDQQEAWAIYGTYPGYDWTNDGKRILIWAQGKIQSVDVATGAATVIPFNARVKQTVVDAVRFPQQVAPDSFDVKMIRWAQVSPDQRRVVYTALNKLWVKDLPDGQPRRLTTDNRNAELFPSWSPDGLTVVYATWDDDSLGAVRTTRLDGRGSAKLTTRLGHYIEPKFSPDGRQVVYRRIGGDGLRTTLYGSDGGVYIVPVAGGDARLVTEEGSDPRFNRAGDRIFLTANESGRGALISVNLNGAERRVHVLADNVTQFTPSPDERFVAWIERFNAYVAPLPLIGRGVDVNGATADFPVRRISRDAGLYLHWSPDSRRVYWALGPELFQRDIARTFAFEATDTTTLIREPEARGTPIGFKAPFDRPTGKLALVGATVITMNGDEVIPNATIIVDRNRITALGPSAQVSVPSDARRVDVAGKYIMPGIVDAHAHLFAGSSGITPKTPWSFLTNLAFGVTTMHDPSNNSEMIFSASESVKRGEILGPRVFSTGTILYGAEGGIKAITTSFDDALMHLRRMQALGAFSVKSYNQPRRDARQQIVEAARELKMMVVPEGGSTFANNLTQVMDGHTTVEHNLPITPLYDDVQRLFAASTTGYTPTLIVNYAGLSGEYYWYQADSVWTNPRLRYFTPVANLEARSMRRQMAPLEDYSFVATARSAKSLADRGVLVNLGAHGQLDGLGAHWELWMLQMGGMTNHQALKTATINPARTLGLDGDIGSLAPGKLADLMVLDANPLDNIRNTTSIRWVMVNGRLFDANNMAQLGNHPAPAPRQSWR
ncbi:MAG TPA: amidohydrolase family protein [Gemmatimonadaceae bacterium]|nr:amidohydrolase family protein [Gemmatimonadaceae bacterium]